MVSKILEKDLCEVYASSASSSEEEVEFLQNKIVAELSEDKKAQREMRMKVNKSVKITKVKEKLMKDLQDFKNASNEI